MKCWFAYVRLFALRKQVLAFTANGFRRTVSLSYRILGERAIELDHPPILLIHGFLESKKRWEGFGKTILNVTKRSVLTVDLRNHGESLHTSSQKYEEMAADVLQLFDKLHIEKCSIIGHNIGGRTAMCVALLEPMRVAGLLVVDISPVSTPVEMQSTYPALLEAMKNVKLSRPKRVRIARKEAKKQLQSNVKDEETMCIILSNINVKQDGTIGWTCNIEVFIQHFKYMASFPISMLNKQYPGPTLFIGGQLSEFIPADDLIGIRELFPRAVIKYIPKAGHNLHIDDPETFLKLALAFIKTHEY